MIVNPQGIEIAEMTDQAYQSIEAFVERNAK
jgi:hypothetical protein